MLKILYQNDNIVISSLTTELNLITVVVIVISSSDYIFYTTGKTN